MQLILSLSSLAILYLFTGMSLSAFELKRVEWGKISQGTALLEYQLVSTTKVSAFEKQLNAFAMQGYKVQIVAQSMQIPLTALVARPKNFDSSEKYQYLLVTPEEFKKQKGELGKVGFSYCGALMQPIRAWFGSPPLLLFEQQSSRFTAKEFELVEADKEEPLEKKINVLGASGYFPISLSRSNALFQRSSAYTQSLQQNEYRLIETRRLSTLEQELNQASQQGFRFTLGGAPINLVLMERRLHSNDNKLYEYRVVSLEESEKPLHLLNEVAKRFRFVGVSHVGMTAIFERQIGLETPENEIEFKVLETRSRKTFEKEFEEAILAGFSPMSMGNGVKGIYSVLLSRKIDTIHKD